VVFGAGFVLCLLLAIILYAQLGKAQQQARDAEQTLNQFATANQRTGPEVTALDRDNNRKTVVGALIDENRQLKSTLAGDPQLPTAALTSRLTQMNVTGSLVQEIERLRTALAAAEDRAAQAESNAAEAAEQLRIAQAEKDELSNTYSESADELKGQLDGIAADLQAYRESIAGMDQKFTGDLAAMRSAKDQEISQLQSRLEKAEQTATVAQRELDDLRKPADGELTISKITSADGVVSSVVADGSQVYINLGRAQHILPGMTFELFDQGELVKLNEAEDLRGKATIEVVSVDENTSLARVVRKERRALVDRGDQLVNIVYDPNAVLKFHVYGDFDLDNSGDSSPSDRQFIENMITSWGGVLAEALAYDVDFLVLGEAPPLPEALPPGTIDPVLIAQNVEAQRNFQQYQTLIGEARSLSIPILNQNRFLALVGYYQR
jgi:hypothetical protein